MPRDCRKLSPWSQNDNWACEVPTVRERAKAPTGIRRERTREWNAIKTWSVLKTQKVMWKQRQNLHVACYQSITLIELPLCRILQPSKKWHQTLRAPAPAPNRRESATRRKWRKSTPTPQQKHHSLTQEEGSATWDKTQLLRYNYVDSWTVSPKSGTLGAQQLCNLLGAHVQWWKLALQEWERNATSTWKKNHYGNEGKAKCNKRPTMAGLWGCDQSGGAMRAFKPKVSHAFRVMLTSSGVQIPGWRFVQFALHFASLAFSCFKEVTCSS